ncbi:MAG TPA: hypothetical protein VFY47_01285 [Thermoleophilaceae bacterium]|nr:hypothetical protein [Thermoleophilaceae bacterium]
MSAACAADALRPEAFPELEAARGAAAVAEWRGAAGAAAFGAGAACAGAGAAAGGFDAGACWAGGAGSAGSGTGATLSAVSVTPPTT